MPILKFRQKKKKNFKAKKMSKDPHLSELKSMEQDQ